MEEELKRFENMMVKELREEVKKTSDHTGIHAMKKEELLKILIKDRGLSTTKEGGPIDLKKKLKRKIKELKQKKIDAEQNKDRKSIQLLLKSINRLKKKTRKVARTASA